ncbi:MAG TPA: hypothetical protein VEF04_00185 [Blastocatellia bacterium]|nr:hypothetical protein [Blastocatellia bacterium]
MNDTSPEIEKLFREMIMARSGAERVQMGTEMFEAARKIILASFPPGLSQDEIRRRLFERIYAEELRAGTIDSPWSQRSVDSI